MYISHSGASQSDGVDRLRNAGEFTAAERAERLSPPNRFERVRVEADLDQLDSDAAETAPGGRIAPEIDYFLDRSESLVAETDRPPLPSPYSGNPSRGCLNARAYCYARPTHEYLGWNAGRDFDTRILVKPEAPALLRRFLSRPAWRPEAITFSGVTDCYQPAERHFRLTRGCLEVVLEFRQPISIITKNALVTRDLDLLAEMAAANLASVAISLTTLDARLAGGLEPRTSGPPARLRAIRELSAAGVPTMVMTAPIIPGLNDSEIPALLAAAADAGARAANFTMLRLPLAVQPIFLEWLGRTEPLKYERVVARIRDTRGGELNDSRFGGRMRGHGEMARQIEQTFQVFARKHGLHRRLAPLDATRFRLATDASGQRRLF